MAKPGAKRAGPVTRSTGSLLAQIERLKAELDKAQVRIAELESHVHIDPLLAIFNRRGFERELERSLAYVKRYGTGAVLIYLDLDGFKAVNDQHGHAAGDALLRKVATTLVEQVRASDVVARLGGDEFAVLMWNVSEGHAAAKAADIELVVAKAIVEHRGKKLSVGASAGVAALSPLDTPAEAIDAADRAMYVRKRARREK